MNDPGPNAATPLLTIAAVERETRIGKDTLRVWERRYGFPRPVRDANGERLYTPDEVEQLRLVKRLLDAGHRPGRVLALDPESRGRLGRSAAARSPVEIGRDAVAPRAAPAADEIEALLETVRSHEPARLRAALHHALLRQGLARFVLDTAVPLLRRVGEAWADGELAVYEEHLCSDVLDSTLRGALAATVEPLAARAPRVLLTTLQGESHGLALLMAAALLSVEGCACIQLGRETPAADVARAAAACQADVVAVSFSAAQPVPHAARALAELRALLPAAVQIWAGSPHAGLQRRGPGGVVVLDSLARIGDQVAAWRRAALPAA